MEDSATEEPELSGASGCAPTNGTEGRYKAREISLAEKNWGFREVAAASI